MNGVTNPFDDIQNAVFMRMRENRHEKEAEQRRQEAFQERQDLINDSISDFNSGTKSETSSFEDQVTDPTKEATKDTTSQDTTPADILEDTHKDTDFSQEDAIKEAEKTVSAPEKSRNEAIQDSMNEKLEDKGIIVDNVNSKLADKHGLNSTKQVPHEVMEEKKEALRNFNDEHNRTREDTINNPHKKGYITQGTGSQKSQSQSHDSRDDKNRPADLL